MVGTNDSLYIITNTPDGQGMLFRIDENGESYEVIWEFDTINFAPNSILANDTVIYGISSSQIFGINPFDGEIRISKQNNLFAYNQLR